MSKRSLRRAMMQAVTPEDISEIMKLQVFLARKGDPVATREVLDRVVGRPTAVVDVVEDSSNSALNVQQSLMAMDYTIPALPSGTSSVSLPHADAG